MKTIALFAIAAALASLPLNAADSNAKDEINAAAKKLGNSDNYSWRTTVVVPEDAPFKPGPTDGKAEKDGYTWLSISMGDNETKAVLKGDKGAAKTADGDWQSLSDLAKEEGFIRFLAMRLQTFKAPVAQAEQLVSFTKELKKDGDTYSGELTEEGAKTMMSFRPRSGGDAPSVSNAKGSVKFWLKDGALTKYEFNLKGTMNFNGNDIDQDRTSTVIIKDVGSTKVTVPEEAKKKLS
jgi:hypothetical protein